ncbi:MAG: hypothetical protein IKH61_10315 [Bacteroidales bacterium]|jgi:hypothetical protein|nr:hypothetical protein [Bacteroidales bacterium]
MKASITFPELQSILQEKTNQQISFSTVDSKTVRVTYPLNLGFVKKDISANLTIIELIGSDLLVSIDAGFGTDTMLNTVLGLLKNKIPEGLIEKRPDKRLMLHLGQIEQVKTVFEAIQVNDISVLANGLEVDGGLK